MYAAFSPRLSTTATVSGCPLPGWLIRQASLKSASHYTDRVNQPLHSAMTRSAATKIDSRSADGRHQHPLSHRCQTNVGCAALSLVLTLLILLSSLSLITSAALPPKCLSSLPPHRFEPKPARPSTSLTFCKEYSSSTCCNATHTQSITRQLYPYFSTTFDERDEGYGVSEECRQLAASLHCSACHPLVGTGQLVGVCGESCDALYVACAPSLFEHMNGLLQPCSPSTLVCSELSTFVSSGSELCRHLGFTIGRPSPSSAPPSLSAASASSSSDLHSAFTSLLSASQSTEQPSCFHASSSPASLSSPSTKRTATKSTATASTTPSASSPFSSFLTTIPSLSSLSTFLTSLPALLTTLPASVAQWRKRVRRLMRSHMSSGVSIAVLLALVVFVMCWPRIRGWLNRQRWKARLTADGIRRQRVARLGNSRQ